MRDLDNHRFFTPNRWLVALLVCVCLAALFSLLCFMQFGPSNVVAKDTVRPTFRFGHDAIALPEKHEPLAAADNGRQRLVKQLVFLTIKADSGRIHLGTGFLIDRDVVVTTAHSTGLDAHPPIEVACFGKRLQGRRILNEQSRDLAVISAPGCGGEHVQFATSSPGSGEKLAVVGYNVSLERLAADRFAMYVNVIGDARLIVPDAQRDGRDGHIVQKVLSAGTQTFAITGDLQPGNSGSPVIREDGSIVGMLFVVSAGNQGQRTFAIAAAEIATALAVARVQ
jgi:S1-C subfamily serine protease